MFTKSASRKRPRESRTISCVPRFLEFANEVRDDPLTIEFIHTPHPPSRLAANVPM
jgi:hypothetical protein